MTTTCNGCDLERHHAELGDELLVVDTKDKHPGSVELYRLDAEPAPGQGEKVEHEGRPVRFLAWLMSPRHACGAQGKHPRTLSDERRTRPMSLRALAVKLARELDGAAYAGTPGMDVDCAAELALDVLVDARARAPRTSADVLELCPELVDVEERRGYYVRDVAELEVSIPSEWRMKGGEVVAIEAMSDSHLFNTVCFLIRAAARRRAREVGESIGFMGSKTWGPRGEGAQMACEDAARELCDLTWADRACGSLWAMLAEARRRGLPCVDQEGIAAYGRQADASVFGLELATMKRVTDADKLAQVRDAIR